MAEHTDMSRLPLSKIHELTEQANADAASAKARLAAIKNELGRRFGESVKQALDQQGKEHGTVTLPMQDGFTLKGERKQTVKWDSAKLMGIAQTLPWERVQQLFKIEFSMSETIYKGIGAAAPELRERIDAARTTTLGDPVATLKKED